MTASERRAARRLVSEHRRRHVAAHPEARHLGPRAKKNKPVPASELRVIFGYTAPISRPTRCVYCGKRTRRIACPKHLGLLLLDPVYTPATAEAAA